MTVSPQKRDLQPRFEVLISAPTPPPGHVIVFWMFINLPAFIALPNLFILFIWKLAFVSRFQQKMPYNDQWVCFMPWH